MKKRFVALLALGLVTASLFAAINFSGTATVGYKFTFDGTEKGIYDEDGTSAGYFPVNASIAATTDYAKISFRTAESMSLNSLNLQAQITLYLSKALADAGLELPVSLTAYVGNDQVSGFYAYSDPTSTVDDNYDGFRSANNNRNDYPVALDIGYKNLVTVRGQYDFFNGAKGYMASAKSTPITGVNVALSFANNPTELKHGTIAAGYGVNASALVDIATLAKLDFKLDASAMGFFGFGDGFDGANNIYLAAVTGGYQDIGAYVEYTYNDYENGIANKHGLSFGASYKGVKNLGLSAGLTLKDLTAVQTSTLGYYVKAAYTLGNVTYTAKFCDINSKPGMKLQMSLGF
ncbi:MAG: hypothetical protein SPD11_04970 [Sphaerochaetaceae bacterium]|nr:hypothetical protein [Sphaerochaetaceae bacterium]